MVIGKLLARACGSVGVGGDQGTGLEIQSCSKTVPSSGTHLAGTGTVRRALVQADIVCLHGAPGHWQTPSLLGAVGSLWDMGQCWELPLSTRGHRTFPQHTHELRLA